MTACQDIFSILQQHIEVLVMATLCLCVYTCMLLFILFFICYYVCQLHNFLQYALQFKEKLNILTAF